MAQVLVSMDSDEEGVLQQLKELDELASMMKMDESRGNDDYEDEDEDEGTEEETADAILKELEELDRIATGTQGYEEYTRDKDEDGEGLAHNRDLDHDELKELRRLIQKRELLKEKLRILKKREMLQNKLKELERQKREALRRRAEHEASSPHSRESTPMEDSSIIEADLGFKTRGWNNEIKFEKANLDDSTSPEHSLIGIEHDYFNQSVDCLSGKSPLLLSFCCSSSPREDLSQGSRQGRSGHRYLCHPIAASKESRRLRHFAQPPHVCSLTAMAQGTEQTPLTSCPSRSRARRRRVPRRCRR
eukprot:765212-Hanusia_phi.AAC.7